jgi:hypothetical protein
MNANNVMNLGQLSTILASIMGDKFNHLCVGVDGQLYIEIDDSVVSAHPEAMWMNMFNDLTDLLGAACKIDRDSHNNLVISTGLEAAWHKADALVRDHATGRIRIFA